MHKHIMHTTQAAGQFLPLGGQLLPLRFPCFQRNARPAVHHAVKIAFCGFVTGQLHAVRFVKRLLLFRRGNFVFLILVNGTERSNSRRRSKCQQTLAAVFQPDCPIVVGQFCHTGTGFVALFGFFAVCQEIADNSSCMFSNRAAPGCKFGFVIVQILLVLRSHSSVFTTGLRNAFRTVHTVFVLTAISRQTLALYNNPPWVVKSPSQRDCHCLFSQ